MRIYLDNAATTPVDPEVLKAMLPYFSEKFGNASSIHSLGRESREAIERAREVIAKRLNVKPNEVIFTSGGTEANNLAIKGVALANKDKGKHIITQKTEHKCVLNSCKFLEKLGFEVTYLDVDEYGRVNPEDVESAIRDDTILVSIMHVNNETGTIQPIEEIAEICKDKGVYFHTDACQSFTKLEIDAEKMNLDMITINAHKIHGPKGVGALIVRENVKIESLLHGGGHEFGKRSGTENVPGIVGFGKAVEIMTRDVVERIWNLGKYFMNRILNEVDRTVLNGHPEKRVYHIIDISFLGIEGESLVLLLDRNGIYCSTASACASKSLEPSHVLRAMKLEPERIHGAVRFSLGKQNTKEEIEYAIEKIKESVEKLRRLSPYGGSYV